MHWLVKSIQFLEVLRMNDVAINITILVFVYSSSSLRLISF